MLRLGVGAIVMLVECLRTEGVFGIARKYPVRGVMMVNFGVDASILGVSGTTSVTGFDVEGTDIVGLECASWTTMLTSLSFLRSKIPSSVWR